MKSNIIILEGGLGNRMRVAASALAMARRTGVPMQVIWTSQWGMRCRFDELFEAVPSSLPQCPSSFSLLDARGFERFLFARPTMLNLHLPRLMQCLSYRHIIYSPQIWYLNRDGFDYEAWFRHGGTLMTSYRDFCSWTIDDLRTLFRPNVQVRRLVEERCQAYSNYTIGVHIRRTDHQQAIDESPLELFQEAIDHEADLHPDLSVYLATDDEETKQRLRQRYGSRILTSPVQATRDNSDGIREGLVDMFTLSRTRCIYGSAGSTFSPMAACMGDVPIRILQRDGAGTVDLLCPTKSNIIKA